MKMTAIIGSLLSTIEAAAARSVPVFLALIVLCIVMVVAFYRVLGDNRRAANLANLLHGPTKPPAKRRKKPK